ncbi:hypothetical protein H3Z74_02665 [Sphingomonas alpina]|uniref:Uncharacterized protein n=3 Tax=Sphingomonas alpina TaxID=653931 RepID=A0A7H0LKG5_9SPHN|nr:hypothetical protein H3Z74_02665 [Sphingomonas alpina]
MRVPSGEKVMNLVKAGAVGFVLLMASGGAAQAQNACLIEGEMMSEAIKDCSETSLKIPAADYAEQCSSNSNGPLKATVLKACPPRAQAKCVGPYGQPVTTYYYARSPKSLADTKSSCTAQRGKWVLQP